MIGIDPGLDGGIAFIDSKSKCLPDVEIMPIYGDGKGRELHVARIVDWIKLRDPDLVVIEKVWAIPRLGAKQGAASMFKFGTGFGILQGIVQTLDYEMLLVPPKTWKSKLLFDTKKDKAASIGWCIRKYPRLDLMRTPKCRHPHDGMAEAVLLAWYGTVAG